MQDGLFVFPNPNRLQVRTCDVGKPPAFHFNQEDAELGKNDNEIGMPVIDNRLVVDHHIIRKFLQNRKEPDFSLRGFRGKFMGDGLGHGVLSLSPRIRECLESLLRLHPASHAVQR